MAVASVSALCAARHDHRRQKLCGTFPARSWPRRTKPSSITFLQMLLAGILYSSFSQTARTQQGCLAVAADVLTAAPEAAWPTSTDQARPAITRHLSARHWVPDPEQPAATEHGGTALSPTAAALQRDLQRHAPEISLSLVELRSSVMLKRALWAANAPAPLTAAERVQREMQVLLDNQQAIVLSSGASPGSPLDAIHFSAVCQAVVAALEVTESAVRGTGAAVMHREGELMRIAEETVQSGLAAKREWPTHGYFMGWCQGWYAGCSEWQLPACLPPSQRPCGRLFCTTRLPLRTCQLPLTMPHDCCIYLLESAGWMATHSATRLLASKFWQYAQIITPRGRVLDADLLRRAERLLGAGRSCLPHLKRCSQLAAAAADAGVPAVPGAL